MNMLWNALIWATFIFGILLIANTVVKGLYSFLTRKYRFSRLSTSRLTENESKFSLYDIPVVKSLKTAMDIAEMKSTPASVIALTILLYVAFVYASQFMIIYLQNYYGIIATGEAKTSNIMFMIFGLLGAMIPLVWVYFRLQNKRREMSYEMIDLDQSILSVVNEKDNIMEIVRKVGVDCPPALKKEWLLLYSEISAGTKVEDALNNFAERVGNDWAENLSDILVLRNKFASDISPQLKSQIDSMNSAYDNEKKRQSMFVAFRIGCIVFVAATYGIVFFNINLDPNNFKYYFQTVRGNEVILASLIVSFLSVVGVILSGRKKL